METLHFTMNKQQSELRIDADAKALQLHVSDISLEFKFDYSITTDPEFVNDIGKAHVSIANCDLGLKLALLEKDGTLQVEFSDVKMNM